MNRLKDLIILLESALDIKELYEGTVEPENYSLKICELKIQIEKIKIQIIEAINKL